MQYDGFRQAEFFRAQPDGIAFYDACVLQTLDPGPARRGGQADDFAQVLQAQAGVLLQGFQYGNIKFIQFHVALKKISGCLI